MKIQLNNGLISDLPLTAVIATNAGDVEVENAPLQPFDYDYINGEFIRMRWSDWHELTNFQIKFTPIDLLDLVTEHRAMVDYTDNLVQHKDNNDNIYYYVNYFNDMERELIEYYGAIVTERSII